MAETISQVAQSVMGNLRVSIQKVTMGTNSNTADITTGLDSVVFSIPIPLEISAMPSLMHNLRVGNTAVAGDVSLTSGTSAGSYYVVSFGAS